MSSKPAPTCAPSDPVGIFLLGLKVLGSETVWLLRSLPDRLERRQLAKRLAEERKRLESPGDASESEFDVARRQVSFLEDETRLIAEEHARKRARFVARRAARWGLAR